MTVSWHWWDNVTCFLLKYEDFPLFIRLCAFVFYPHLRVDNVENSILRTLELLVDFFCLMHIYWKQLRISAIVHQDLLLSAGGSTASTPYHHSPIISIPALLKLNSSIRSYTLLYRILTFRHIEYWKNLYRCSGTFRQKWLWIFGYFVYWFLRNYWL